MLEHGDIIKNMKMALSGGGYSRPDQEQHINYATHTDLCNQGFYFKQRQLMHTVKAFMNATFKNM